MVKKDMHQWVPALTAAFFFIWLLPLGIFIKPSQEKIACNGQRAICLCHISSTTTQSNNTPKLIITHHTDSNKEARSSGGGSHHYLAGTDLNVMKRLSNHFDSSQHLLSLLLIRSIEHVPKV